MSSVFNRIEPLLHQVERPSRYIGGEWGARPSNPDAPFAVGLCYPGTYDVAQANQAIQILYNAIDCAERVYLPGIDLVELMRAHGIPLFTLESHRPVGELDLLGITLPYELSLTTVLEVLDLSGIPFRTADRTESDPVVIGGGPCAFNPEPVAAFFDAILLGDGEEAALEIVDAVRTARTQGTDRTELHRRLAAIPGVYVPALYEVTYRDDGTVEAVVPTDDAAPATVLRRALTALPEPATNPICPIVPYGEVVHDRLAVEVLRGCTRGCRFCQAGMVYRPVRERTADEIVRAVTAGLECTGYDEVSLTSLSTADHSQIEEVLRRLSRLLSERGISVSLPSLRVDAFSVDLARLISGGGGKGGRKTGLTFAPEAGSQRLRDAINKNVTEEDLIETVGSAFAAGWRRVKLYFMVGLPTETDDDIRAIGALVNRVLEVARAETPPAQRGGIKIGVSVSTFVPKSHTPFQWAAQSDLAEISRKQSVLRDSMPRKGVDLSWHDADTSFVEGVVARGDRRLGPVLEEAWRRGSRLDGWSEHFSLARWMDAFAACDFDPAFVASRQRSYDEVLPWDHLSTGVSKRYLALEAQRAYDATTTDDCSFGPCTGCDACGALCVDVLTAGERR